MLEHKIPFGSRFGRVLGRVFGAFWAILAGFWGFQRRPILKPKLEAEKVVLDTREGIRGDCQAAQLLIVDQSIIDNIHRRSLTSFIVGHSNR